MRCVIEGCDRKAVTRGLCESCYHTALRVVAAGETTWTALEQAGLCGPVMRSPNAFAAAYAKLPTMAKDLPGQKKLFQFDPKDCSQQADELVSSDILGVDLTSEGPAIFVK